MDSTLKQQILFGLETFWSDTTPSPDECVDWVCDQWNLNATDEVIDLVIKAHFAEFARASAIAMASAHNDDRGQDSAFMDDTFGG